MANYILRGILILIILGLQLGAANINRDFVRHINLLEYGNRTTTLAIFSVVLGLVSGILLAYTLLTNQRRGAKLEIKWFLATIFLGIIPLAATLLKLGLATVGPGIFPVSFLRPGWRDLFEWVLYSQVPALWLGLVIGRFLPGQWTRP